MKRARGFTLLELVVAMSIAGLGLSIGTSLLGAERLAGRRHEESFRRTAGASDVLDAAAADLRRAVAVVPRESGPGALLFLSDGSVAIYYDAPGEGGELLRRLRSPGGGVGAPVRLARGVEAFTATVEGRLATARVRIGPLTRSVSVRMRHVP